ncbi:flavodoxin [Reinekea thalattae]|uniref:Flavodoxin n=1 Tax=Reinekea thalattae TaxID=2593301 RepID=A0A5C8Z6U4_9GAMM|nr:flavodoxin [Reinekea thalattae]TXR53029.1 flavodoxin [Reinekea thalattae]
MTKIGIFFGTDTGTTRKMAKTMYKELGEDLADKPLNINRVDAETLSGYDFLILGTPTYGHGELPGLSADCQEESWEEFMPNFDDIDLSGKKVALFGLGDQVNYSEEFVDGLAELYEAVVETGATLVGRWPTEGYSFEASAADDGGEFFGLVLDNDNQSNLHANRISQWLDKVKQEMGITEAAIA